jgi:O-methyltransferase involved in polyketide biosynthesis
VGRVRVFEVDHPASQRWKRDLLAAAGIMPPDGLGDAVPAALWDRSDALRPLDLCRLARATLSP